MVMFMLLNVLRMFLMLWIQFRFLLFNALLFVFVFFLFGWSWLIVASDIVYKEAD
jgi:hypothetical protein